MTESKCPTCGQPVSSDQALQITITRPLCGTRLWCCLMNEGYRHLAELEHVPAWKLMRVPNLGIKSLKKLAKIMKEHDLKLGRFAEPDPFRDSWAGLNRQLESVK